MHVGLSGTKYLAETVPIEEETFNLKDFVLIVESKFKICSHLHHDKFLSCLPTKVSILAKNIFIRLKNDSRRLVNPTSE
jgi:hypothetical protein